MTVSWPHLAVHGTTDLGLGRYGDPLDPDGDLVAMKEAWLKLEPGGHFLLAVPVDVHDQVPRPS